MITKKEDVQRDQLRSSVKRMLELLALRGSNEKLANAIAVLDHDVAAWRKAVENENAANVR